MSTVEALARRAQQVLEPFVAMIYFVPEGPVNYGKIGLKPRQAYFCTRSAALGAVPGAVVASTFYNFNPAIVVPEVNDGWQKTTPQAAAQARNQAVIEALTRLLADESGNLPDVKPAVTLVRQACEGLKGEGRPLFAAHQAQPWPEENDLLSLWWGANLLREYRGDGHIAALLTAGISGLDAILIAGAWSSRVPLAMLLKTRAWSEEEMEQARTDLERRGLLENGALTGRGQELRNAVEDTTDRLAVAPWEKLGEDAQEFIKLMEPLTQRILAGGGVGPRR